LHCSDCTAIICREELLRLLTFWSHEPHFTVTQTTGIGCKGDLRAVRGNRPCRSIVTNVARGSSKGRDHPDAGVLLDGGAPRKIRDDATAWSVAPDGSN